LFNQNVDNQTLQKGDDTMKDRQIRLMEIEEIFDTVFPRAYREFLLTQGTAKIAGYTILGIFREEKKSEEKGIKETKEEGFRQKQERKQRTADIIPRPPKPAKPPALSKSSASPRLPFPGFIKTEKRQEDRQVEKLKPQTEKREYSVVEATEFLHKKRPELKDRKLIPVCFKANRSTGKLMALCMDLSQEPKDDAPLVQISDVDDEHSEQASHDPEFFSEWMAHLKMLEGRHKFFKIAFQRVSNRNNEVLKKHLLKFFEKEFGQKCPLCRSRERRVIVFSKTQGRKTLLVCEECENEWSQLKGRKPELVEWVQEKLESKFNLPSFTEKGMRVVRGEEKKAKTIHLEKHDWRTRVFRVTDYIVGLTSFRYNTLQSCLEVDAFWSGDLAGYEKGQAIRNLAIAILSEASALTGSLALAFTEDIRESEKTGKVMQRGWRKIAERLPELQKQEAEKSYGRISCPVPQELVDFASQHQISLSQSYNGIITHQEGLEIFWAALGWPEHLQAKIDELEEKGYLTKQALASVIYSGIWSKEEAVWFFENAPRPEAILLGSDLPEDRLYYTESLAWARSAYLANLLKAKISTDLAGGISVGERDETDCDLEPIKEFWL